MGNICRSPIAEGVLKALLPTKQVRSAGLIVEKSGLLGAPADKYSIAVAAMHQIDIRDHQAHQLTAQLCEDMDLILVMEQDHIERIASLAPSARSKTLLFGQWSGDGCIDDPYQKDLAAFRLTYQRIEKAAEAWAKRLK